MENAVQCKYYKNLYSSQSTGGMGHLKRYAEQCTKKHGAIYPRHTQLNIGGGSKITGINTFVHDQAKTREGIAIYIASTNQPFF